MSGLPSRPPPTRAPPISGEFSLRYGLPGPDPAGNGEPISSPPATTWQVEFPNESVAERLRSLHDGVNTAAIRGAVPGAARIFAAMLLGRAAVTACTNCGVST